MPAAPDTATSQSTPVKKSAAVPTFTPGGRPVAFEVPADTLVAKTPDAIQQKIREAALGKKRYVGADSLVLFTATSNLSKDDLSAKLDNATQRKKRVELEKLEKAHAITTRAKTVANRVRSERDGAAREKSDKISSKLDHAAQQKLEQVQKKKEKVEQHIQHVVSLKDAAAQEPLTPGSQDIASKLQAAEERRRALEEERKGKIQDHLKSVDEIRAHPPSSPISQAQLQKKLAAAEQRRKESERAQLEKYAAHDAHIKSVRQRRKSEVVAQDGL